MNGKLIHSKEQRSALRQNSAFCKLEVQNHQGESKFLPCDLRGDHHQLGAIVAPDPRDGIAVGLKPVSLITPLANKLHIRASGVLPATTTGGSEETGFHSS